MCAQKRRIEARRTTGKRCPASGWERESDHGRLSVFRRSVSVEKTTVNTAGTSPATTIIEENEHTKALRGRAVK